MFKSIKVKFNEDATTSEVGCSRCLTAHSDASQQCKLSSSWWMKMKNSIFYLSYRSNREKQNVIIQIRNFLWHWGHQLCYSQKGQGIFIDRSHAAKNTALRLCWWTAPSGTWSPNTPAMKIHDKDGEVLQDFKKAVPHSWFSYPWAQNRAWPPACLLSDTSRIQY